MNRVLGVISSKKSLYFVCIKIFTYFTSVHPTAMGLLRDRPIIGSEGSYKPIDGKGTLYHKSRTPGSAS